MTSAAHRADHVASCELNDTDAAPASAAELLAANINPRTGLATDYLNHFNEAIMLLEMIPDMPDCYELFLEWQPMSYAEHFLKSNLSSRDLAIAAYNGADGKVRVEFDTVVGNMTTILMAISAGMHTVRKDETRIRLAEKASDWLRPMVSAAGGIINGRNRASDVEFIMAGAHS